MTTSTNDTAFFGGLPELHERFKAIDKAIYSLQTTVHPLESRLQELNRLQIKQCDQVKGFQATSTTHGGILCKQNGNLETLQKRMDVMEKHIEGLLQLIKAPSEEVGKQLFSLQRAFYELTNVVDLRTDGPSIIPKHLREKRPNSNEVQTALPEYMARYGVEP